MDGAGRAGIARIGAGLRPVAARASVALAMVAIAYLSLGAGASAAEVPSSVRYAVGSPAMTVAQDIARRTWGTDPCGGRVEIAWSAGDPSINARSLWSNPRSAYDAPELNTGCQVILNSTPAFDWPKLCTVVVHEYGHLSGHPHGADGADVMSPIYRAPLPACSAAPDPSAAPPASGPPAAGPGAGAGSSALSIRARHGRAPRARARRAVARSRARARATARAAGLGARRFSTG